VYYGCIISAILMSGWLLLNATANIDRLYRTHEKIRNQCSYNSVNKVMCTSHTSAPLAGKTHLVLEPAIVKDRRQAIPYSRGVRSYTTLYQGCCNSIMPALRQHDAIGPIKENMMSSTKPEVCNILQYCQKWTEPQPRAISTENLVKFGYVVPNICVWTDRQTNSHVHHNNLLPY